MFNYNRWIMIFVIFSLTTGAFFFVIHKKTKRDVSVIAENSYESRKHSRDSNLFFEGKSQSDYANSSQDANSEDAFDISETNKVSITDTADTISGEYVLSFYSSADRKAFIENATAFGADVLGLLDVGNSVRLRVEDRAMLNAILDQSPVSTDLSPNVYVRLPEREATDVMAPDGTYTPFGGNALNWLGLTGDNSSWGSGVTIAVLDNGLLNPCALPGRVRQIDLVDETSADLPASSGHGLAVASLLVGGGDNLRGVVPSADILSIKVLSAEGVGDSFTLAQGIVKAVNSGAGVINLSLGSKGDCHVLRDAVAYAKEKNVLIVAATGNDAAEGVSYPASYKDVIAVAGIDANGRHMYFSNRGEEVDIAAPGYGVFTTWDGDATVGFSGTSAAVPFVSGVAAGLRSENPSLTPADITEILRKYADEAGASGADKRYGAGILNIRRIIDRNRSGIYDIAVARPHILSKRNSAGDMVVQIYAQNQGTESLGAVELEVNAGHGVQSFSFYNVGVGEVVSREIHISPYEIKGEDGLSLEVSANTPHNEDTYPMNNMVSGMMLTK